jgi:serine/threonine protein kinase
MDPQQWECAKQLFQAALAEAPQHRASFVEENCGGDDALRDQVLWLLESSNQAGSFLKRPSLDEITVASSSEGTDNVFPIGSTLLNRFRILSLAGRGGMAEVYEAEDLELHDCIALKTIRSEIARDPESVARFKQEILLARRISHPNVIRLFDLFILPPEQEQQRGVTAFVTMQFLSGVTLEHKIRSIAHLKMDETLSLAIQICNGLGAAHKIGIIHRDFKSSNVMLVASELGKSRAVITDFGLAFTAAQQDAFDRLTGT